MPVDLEALHIVSVAILGSITCDPEQEQALSEKIRVYRKGWPRHPLTRLGLDIRDGFTRHVDFSITRPPRRSGLLRVRLQVHQLTNENTSRRSRDKRILEFHELSDVMDHIEGMDIKVRCHAHVNWAYEPGSHEAIMKLPMLSTSGDILPFESITGVRFKKPSEDGDISIVIDTTREGGIVATAQIPLSDGLSLSLIDEVIVMSSELIEDFVFRVPAEHEDA